MGVNISDLEGKENTAQMWGNLKSGNYKVGFRTIFTYDLSRSAIPYSDWNGKLYPTKETKGRQMQINVWYPAILSKEDKRINFQHYLELMARQTDFGKINKQKQAFADEQFINKTNALRDTTISVLYKTNVPDGNGSFTIEKLNTLKKLETNAYLNAKPINKKFPLVVFPNGTSPAFQSIMCEYFASHGFIVIGVALKGRHAYTEEISLVGMETTTMDLGFAIGKALEIPQVNNEKICLIGNAITSSQSVAYQTRNSNIDCVVSLDGGLPSKFEQSILNRTPFYNPQAVNKPILAIYVPSPSIDPKYIEHLKFSERYFFRFPQMSEFHFLNYGAFEKFVPNIIGKPRGDVEKGFETAAVYCLKFFEAFLKGNEKSLQFLKTKPSDLATIDKHFIKRAFPSPPNITILKDAFTREGFGYIEQTYKKLKKQNPTPFSRAFYNDLKDWLAWKKDPKYENRFKLYQLALDSYPNSAMVNFDLAYYAMKTNRKETSKRHNQKALKLLEMDNSPELTPEIKAKMKELILKDLESLK